MSTTETLSARLQVLLTESERSGVEKLAAKSDRSLSYVAREAIQKALKVAKL